MTNRQRDIIEDAVYTLLEEGVPPEDIIAEVEYATETVEDD